MRDASVRVLLVDDDEDDCVITRDLISRIRERRYQLDWVDTYEAALEAIRRGEHDVCLFDYRLGERTGLELLREAKQLGCRAPMILLTGQGDHEVDLEAMKAGAADYLVKSQLRADALERTMRYAIEGKRAQENLRCERDLVRRITETSPVGIVVTDRTGRITFANHAAEQVLGLARNAEGLEARSVLDWRLTDDEGNPLPEQPSSWKPANPCRASATPRTGQTATGCCSPPTRPRCSTRAGR